MKTLTLKILILSVVLTGCFVSCTNAIEPKYDIYENQEISACGINNPLQNIEWLKNYCEDVKKRQGFVKVSIGLHKTINEDEYFFCIVDYFRLDSDRNIYGDYGHDAEWRNCAGEFLFHIPYPGAPPSPDSPFGTFMKDKEYVAELFHFINQ